MGKQEKQLQSRLPNH